MLLWYQSEDISSCHNPEWILTGSRQLATVPLFHWTHGRRLNSIPLDHCTLYSGHGNYGRYMDCVRRPTKNGPVTVEQLYPERVLTCHSSSLATVTIHFPLRNEVYNIAFLILTDIKGTSRLRRPSKPRQIQLLSINNLLIHVPDMLLMETS